MTNLFGRGKEPFWQQASTNLVKFVILLHQVLEDYVTLFQVIVVEDTAELQIDHANLVRFDAGWRNRVRRRSRSVTSSGPRCGTRPDRIIVGEVRGGKAFDLLQALNIRHAGTLSTIHANSGAPALARLASCALQSGVELTY